MEGGGEEGGWVHGGDERRRQLNSFYFRRELLTALHLSFREPHAVLSTDTSSFPLPVRQRKLWTPRLGKQSSGSIV